MKVVVSLNYFLSEKSKSSPETRKKLNKKKVRWSIREMERVNNQ